MEEQADLHQDELLQHQPLPRPLGLRGRARLVHRQGRVGAAGQTLAYAKARGQRVAQPPHVAPHALHDGAQQARRDLFTRGVDGHEPLRVHGLAVLLAEELVAADEEGGPSPLRAERAADAHQHARLEDPGQIPLIEPRRLDRPGGVTDHGADHVDPLARGPVGADALDHAAHRRLLSELEVAHVLTVAEVLVAAREVVDQVSHGGQAESGKTTGGDLADTRQAGERTLERGGVDGEARDRRHLLVVPAGEAQGESGPVWPVAGSNRGPRAPVFG